MSSCFFRVSWLFRHTESGTVRVAEDSFDAGAATARDVMTPGIHCCREDDDLAKAVRHMEGLKVRRLPVINKSNRMVGILSLGDVSRSASGDLLSECVKSV